MSELEEQSAPSASCPTCGGEPEHDPQHSLSACGYLHDDIQYTCKDCENQWVHGVPIGEYEGPKAADLFCNACEDRYALVHRVQAVVTRTDDRVRAYRFHLKCPECYAFWTITRRSGQNGTCLVGYPQTTGNVEEADEEYAYDRGEMIEGDTVRIVEN